MYLTNQEQDVLDDTVALVNSYCKLPEEHPADKNDFLYLIHRIQDLIMSRPTRRSLDES